jgi:hypothetical protein
MTDDMARAIDEARARETRALDALERLRRCVDRKAYMTAEDQFALREADALLVEVGR